MPLIPAIVSGVAWRREGRTWTRRSRIAFDASKAVQTTKKCPYTTIFRLLSANFLKIVIDVTLYVDYNCASLAALWMPSLMVSRLHDMSRTRHSGRHTYLVRQVECLGGVANTSSPVAC